MLEVLERIVEKNGSVSTQKRKKYLGEREYSNENASKDAKYSTFAEMYLETPINTGSAKKTSILTCTSCTWRDIPTIDDW